MKKSIFAVLTAVALIGSSCTSGFGNLLGGNTTGNTGTGSILSSVLGGVLGTIIMQVLRSLPRTP